MNETLKCLNYRIYKTELKLENYLLCLPNHLAVALCKFRCLNSNYQWKRVLCAGNYRIHWVGKKVVVVAN